MRSLTDLGWFSKASSAMCVYGQSTREIAARLAERLQYIYIYMVQRRNPPRMVYGGYTPPCGPVVPPEWYSPET